MTVPRRYLFCGSFVCFVSCVSHAFTSVHCCIVVTYWERADLLALLGGVYCILVTLTCSILDQVLYLIVSLFQNLILAVFLLLKLLFVKLLLYDTMYNIFF